MQPIYLAKINIMVGSIFAAVVGVGAEHTVSKPLRKKHEQNR
jgi:hypothetical protein